MPAPILPNTRYLVRRPLAGGPPEGTLADAIVAEIAPSGAVVRVIWAASSDGLLPPAEQTWEDAAAFLASIVEVLPPSLSQIHRAKTTSALLRQEVRAGSRTTPQERTMPGRFPPPAVSG